MKKSPLFVSALVLSFAPLAWPIVLSSLRGVVHDPDHRPVANARVVVKSSTSDYSQVLATDSEGVFETTTVPVGKYEVTVTRDGFEPEAQEVVVSSREAPVLHFQLVIGKTSEVVSVQDKALTANPDTMTPTTIVSRKEISETPGADLTNNMNMITDYVPGA